MSTIDLYPQSIFGKLQIGGKITNVNAICQCEKNDCEQTFAIGGATIYRSPLVHTGGSHLSYFVAYLDTFLAECSSFLALQTTHPMKY